MEVGTGMTDDSTMSSDRRCAHGRYEANGLDAGDIPNRRPAKIYGESPPE